MGFFSFGKKKEECCCSSSCTTEEMNAAEATKHSVGIKVLGGGCSKCHELEANTKAALDELSEKENVELITDFSVIASYGVMTTPALVIDNKVVAYGKVLNKTEIIKLYKTARG